jgi:hypothetical protein
MVTRVPLKLKDSAGLQDFSSTEENYLAYQVGNYLINGDSSDVGSLTMDASGGTQSISGTFTDTAYDSAVGTGGSPGSFLTFTQTNTTLRTNLGTLTPADSDYRIPVFREHDSDRGTITVGRPSSIPSGSAGYVTISNVSGDSLTIKIPSSRNKVFDTFCASSINIADSAANGTAVAGGNISLGSNLHEPPKLSAPIVKGVTTGRYVTADSAYVFNVENVTIGGTAYSSSEANQEYQAGDDYIYVDGVNQDIYQSKIREYNDSDMTVLIDRLNSRIATSDYLGSYRLGSSAPSSDYSVNLADVMTDTRTDGSSIAYNIYQRTTQSAPTQVLPFSIKRSSGNSGDYQGLQLMTDRQIQQGLGLRARNRLGTTGDNAGTNIGNYKLLSSASGTPTDLGFSGTWAARGTATDTRQNIVDANYTRGRVSTYARLAEVSFSDNYSRTRSSAYSKDYSRIRSSSYIDTYTVNRESNYSVGFVGEYSRNYETTRSSNYTRTRQSTLDYTRNRASTFTGNYSRVVSYEGNFLGDYSRNVAEITSVSGSLTTTGTGLKTVTVSGTGVSDFTVTINVSSGAMGGGVMKWVGPSGTTFDEDYGVFGTSTNPTTLFTDQSGVGLSNSQVSGGYTIYVNITEVPYESSSYVGNYVSSWTAGDNTPGTGAYGNWVVYGPPNYDYRISVNWTENGNYNLKTKYQRTFSTQAERDAFTNKVLGYDGVEYRRGSYVAGPAAGVGIYKTEKATASYTRNSLANYTRTSTRNSTNTVSYSRNRDSTFTGNYSRIVDYLGNYSRDFLGNYSRDFTRTTPDDFTRNFEGNYSRDFSRTRSSAYTRDRLSAYSGNYTGNFQGNYVGNYIGDFVGPRVLTAQGNTDTTIYSNTLQVLGTETHILNPDGDLANTTYSTPITTAPVGTKAIIVTGGIGTNGGRYTKFSGCKFNLTPNVTLTEFFSFATFSPFATKEYTHDSVIYGGNIGDSLNSLRQFRLEVEFDGQARAYGAGIRVLFLNKEFKSTTLSAKSDMMAVASGHANNFIGYYPGSTTFTNYVGGISVFTATIYDAPNSSAAIGAYVSGAIISQGYNNAPLVHASGDRDSIHGYRLETNADTNITPGARRFKDNYGETLLAATFQEDAFEDNTQNYLRASTRTSLTTSTRTSTRTGTSIMPTGQSPNEFTGNFSGNFTGNYTRFANTTNEGDTYGGQGIDWSARDSNGDSIMITEGPTYIVNANTSSYLSYDGNSMSISLDFNSYAVNNYPIKSNGFASQLSVRTTNANVIPPDTEITLYWRQQGLYKWMRIIVPEDYNVGRPSQTFSGTASNGGPTLVYHTFTVEDGLEFGIGEEGSEQSGTVSQFTATPGSTEVLLRIRANETGYTRDSTRTSTRTSQTFTGNYSRNFEGNYSRNYTRTRTSTYLGSDTFSRTFTGNYVGNYSRDFTRTFEGNYSRNFIGNYLGNYTSDYLGNYGRTFIGNYAGNTIGSGDTNIETYTLYVRTA